MSTTLMRPALAPDAPLPTEATALEMAMEDVAFDTGVPESGAGRNSSVAEADAVIQCVNVGDAVDEVVGEGERVVSWPLNVDDSLDESEVRDGDSVSAVTSVTVGDWLKRLATRHNPPRTCTAPFRRYVAVST